MSSRSSQPAWVGALIATVSASLAALLGALAAPASAAEYKMVACSGPAGAPPYSVHTNTTSPQNTAGIFSVWNACSGQGGDPPGDGVHLRIAENQPSGNAGNGAYLSLYFDAPPAIHFRAAGGYTRQPNAFNDGWRARFWVAGPAGAAQLMTQGAGLPNANGQWASTSTFGPHLWPYSSYWDFTRFVYELTCVRAAGCDRANFNATDLNGIVFVLSDDSPAGVSFTSPGSALMQGAWVRGTQQIAWQSSDLGSGLRLERVRVDGKEIHRIDYQAAGQCATAFSQTNGEWARIYNPCPGGGPHQRSLAFETGALTDGVHQLEACAQDYGQYQGLNGTGGESCVAKTIRTDNTAPGAPLGLHVVSENPNRYLPRIGASFSLPPNDGSPIAKVHYEIVDEEGELVVPAASLAASNPTEIPEIQAPSAPGDYRLRVWLEDQVGLTGPKASVAIPRDTTPPAAPQHLSVTAPDVARSAQAFDVRWRNIPDAGSPIAGARYQVLRGSSVVVPTQELTETGIEAIHELQAPSERGQFTLRLWLVDAEGNVGAPASVPLAHECVRSPVGGGLSLSAGFGPEGRAEVIRQQGQGSVLTGALRGPGGGIAEAPICVFSTVITESRPEFLGIAMTGEQGSYHFAIDAGPSRRLRAVYRPGQRQIAATATAHTRVRPVLKLRKAKVRNKSYAHFSGHIPGPSNARVVVVLQVKSGEGWRAFRRYRTREDGRFALRYRFGRTSSSVRFTIRAQVRSQAGYPYLQGNSGLRSLTVLGRP